MYKISEFNEEEKISNSDLSKNNTYKYIQKQVIDNLNSGIWKTDVKEFPSYYMGVKIELNAFISPSSTSYK